MPTDFSAVVDRINRAFPDLLRSNTHAADGEFLERVAKEPECVAERVGLLSKSEGENGYTFPNGIRTSHDVIAWPNGERVDIIQSAGASPTPGGPTWQVIPEYDEAGNPLWRPTNVWVDISTWPIYDSGTGSGGEVVLTGTIGFGWFCLQTAMAEWPDEFDQNWAWLMNEMNPDCFRVMLAVEGLSHNAAGEPDVWRDAGVFITEDWENRYKNMLDHVGAAGKQVHATVYGGRNQTPSEDDRRRFHDRIIAASAGRWEAIRSFEMMNEYAVNHWTAEEVRAAGRDLRSKLPAGFRLSLSSPFAAHGGSGPNPTNEEMQASFDELYGGDDHAGANEITIHTMRDEGKWSDPFAYNFCYPELPKINNEPPGPGSSAGGMYADESTVYRDCTKSFQAGWAMYVGHSEWCVWNGHLPQEYWNGWREVRFVSDVPHMPEIASCLKSIGEGVDPGPPSPSPIPPPVEPDMPIPPYDEPWIAGTVRPAVVAKYAEHGAALDDMYPVWITRTLYDHDAGMTQQASLDKHLAELEAALGGGS